MFSLKVVTFFTLTIVANSRNIASFIYPTGRNCPIEDFPLYKPLGYFLNTHLLNRAPPDCECEFGERFVVSGGDFADKCCCTQIQEMANGKVCKKDDSIPRCPDVPELAYASDIGMSYYWRIKRFFNNSSLADGCCPSGKSKWVIPAVPIGLDHNVCMCINTRRFIVQHPPN